MAVVPGEQRGRLGPRIAGRLGGGALAAAAACGYHGGQRSSGPAQRDLRECSAASRVKHEGRRTAGRGTPSRCADLVEPASRRRWPRRASPPPTWSWPGRRSSGERLAGHCEPVKMQWPRARRRLADDAPAEPATLVRARRGRLRAGAAAPRARDARARQRLFSAGAASAASRSQGPVGRDRPAQRPPPRARRRPPWRERASAVGGVADDGLREALVRLGAGIMARGRPSA